MKPASGGTGIAVVRNATVLLSSSFFTRFLILGFSIVLARRLGVGQFGVYSFALSYVALLSVVVEFSLQQLIIRDVSRNPDLAGAYFSNALVLKGLFFLSALLLIPITTRLLGYSQEIQTVLYILSIGLLFDAVTNCCIALFNAAQQMHYSGALGVTEEICFTALALATLGLGGELTAIVACRVVAQAITQFTGVLILTKKLHVRPQKVNYAVCKNLSRRALHFFGVSFFTSTARNIDTVLLLSMQGPAAVGIYAAATKIVKLSTYFSKAFSDALYPVISKQAALPDRTLLAKTYRESVKWIMIGVVPFVAFATVQSENIMRALYGADFIEASFVFQIFAWRAGVGFLTQFCGSTLFALEQQKTVFKATGIAAGASILLYLILIPRFSYTGAAFAACATLAIEFLLQFPAVHQRLKSAPLEGVVVKPLVGGLAMAVVCQLFGSIPLIPLAILGLAVYGGSLVLLRAISREDLEMLLRISMTILNKKRVGAVYK